jgi:hypothetical protein
MEKHLICTTSEQGASGRIVEGLLGAAVEDGADREGQLTHLVRPSAFLR